MKFPVNIDFCWFRYSMFFYIYCVYSIVFPLVLLYSQDIVAVNLQVNREASGKSSNCPTS